MTTLILLFAGSIFGAICLVAGLIIGAKAADRELHEMDNTEPLVRTRLTMQHDQRDF